MCQSSVTAVALDMLQYGDHERKRGFTSWTLEVSSGLLSQVYLRAGKQLKAIVVTLSLSAPDSHVPASRCNTRDHCGFRGKPTRAGRTFCRYPAFALRLHCHNLNLTLFHASFPSLPASPRDGHLQNSHFIPATMPVLHARADPLTRVYALIT